MSVTTISPRQLADLCKSGKIDLLDVRTPSEYAAGHIPDAVNIPLDELRSRLGELLDGGEIAVYCQVGQRGSLATRILRRAGFDAVNVGGGYRTYRLVQPDGQRRKP